MKFVSTVIVLSAVCIPFAAKADETYTIRQKYKVGDVDKFKTHMVIEGIIAVEVDIMNEETVKSVKEDGTVTIESKVISSKVVMNGAEMKLPGQDAGTVSTSSYDKDGKMVKRDGGGGGGRGAAGIMGLARPSYLPEKSMKAREEFKIDVSNKDGEAIQSTKGTVTVVGLEKAVKEINADAVKVKIVTDSVISSPMGDTKPHTEGFVYVDPVSGKMLLFKANLSGIQVPNLGEAKVAITRTLIKPDVK